MLIASIPSTKEFPWTALALFLSAYITLGMFLAECSLTQGSWVLAIAGMFLITIVFTVLRFQPESGVSYWLQSDTNAFILLVVSAAFLSIILLWLDIFLKLVAVWAAETLVRLELRYDAVSVTNSFWLLMMLSFAGLVLGWLVSRLLGA
ncbi:MAG: hypothetical protein RBJ76_07860 [Stenomitos frigidus ULC029]